LVPELIPLVADPDRFIAYSARTALRRVNDWKAVAAGLDHAVPAVRTGIMLAMEMAYDLDAASALARFASDSNRDPGERAQALTTLAQGHRRPIPWDGKWWGTQPAKTKPPAKTIDWPGTTAVLEAVRGGLDDPSSEVRRAAVDAVIEEEDRDALGLLRKRFPTEPDEPVRAAVARALGVFKDAGAVPVLAEALRQAGASDALRDAALAAIESIGNAEALQALLGLLREGTLGEGRQPRLVAALGRFGSPEAVNALIVATSHGAPSVRAAAAEALARAGRGDVSAPPLRKLLGDPVLEVRKAAINALGTLQDREAIAGLLAASDATETWFEAARALAAIPDVRAVRVYLRGLTDKSGELRRASSTALAHVHEDAVPLLEQLAARKELPSSAIAELRKIYTAPRPIRAWRLLGPFPIKNDPPFPVVVPIDFKATHVGVQDEPVAWKSVEAGRRGMVDLARIYKDDADLAAYGYAEVTSPSARKAEFLVGSDDTLTVWINGEKVFDYQDLRGFSPDSNRFDAPLNEGLNRILVHCGNGGGPWRFAVALGVTSEHAFLKGPAPGAFDPDAFRSFAMKTSGRPERGKSLFQDLKGLACVKCHAVGGSGGTVGPDLTSVGLKYPREELTEAVLYPSAKILSGYEPVILATTDGRVLNGIVKGENPDSIEIEDAEAKRVRLPKSEIDERKVSNVSLMPNGLAEGLTPDDFADLIAYLQTLKDEGPRR
jgi:putative heme-binding domain-containing protein